jgi:hypothetical protein
VEIIKVKLRLTNGDMTFDEKAELIIQQLRALADTLEECKGNAQTIKGSTEGAHLEYVHLKEA